MTPTPTSPERTWPRAGHATLTAALDDAATTVTGVNLYGQRGELQPALPYAEIRATALRWAGRLQAAGLARISA